MYMYTGVHVCASFWNMHIHVRVNAGLVTPFAFSDFICECEAGWTQNADTGACTTRICELTYCMHEATCTSDQTGCVCPAGHSGDHCELSTTSYFPFKFKLDWWTCTCTCKFVGGFS